MQLPIPAPSVMPQINNYAVPLPANNPQLPKKSKKVYIIAAVIVVALVIFIGLFFALKKLHTQPDVSVNTDQNAQSENLITGPLDEIGAQSTGGIISTPSGQANVPSITVQQIAATIYEIAPDSVSFLANNQLLSFPINEMSLFTKVENLQKNQKVQLKITRSAQTSEIQSVQVTDK